MENAADNILTDACQDAIRVFRFGDRINRRVPIASVALSLQIAAEQAAPLLADEP